MWLHTRSRTHLQTRSSLIFDDMSIWCTRTSSRDLASFLWELYAFLHEYYTTKSRNLQPLRILGGSCTWQRPRSMLRSLSPQVSMRFQRGLKDIKWYSRVVSCERLSISIKSKDIFIKVFKTYFLINSVSVVTQLVCLHQIIAPILPATNNTLIIPVITSTSIKFFL